MTVKKLIELLNALDDEEKELEVCIDEGNGGTAVEAEFLGVITDEDGDCICFKIA